MKKIISIIAIAFVLFGMNDVYAQRNIRSGYNRTNYSGRYASGRGVTHFNNEKIYFGAKSGINLSYMLYDSYKINASYRPVIKPLPISGVFIEFKFGEVLAIAPTFEYKGYGTILKSSLIEDTPYKFTSHTINFELPFYFDLPIGEYVRPYLLVSPEVNVNIGGRIKLGDYAINTGTSSVSKFNSAVKLGAGLDFWYEFFDSDAFVRVDAGYSFGLTNTYSEMELNGESVPVNMNSWKAEGYRKTRGIEICVSFAFPFYF